MRGKSSQGWRGALAATSLILSSLATSGAVAGTDVCVRDFLKPEGGPDMCARGIPGFAYVETRAGNKLCIRLYDDQHCKNSPDAFDHVFGMDGKTLVCTVDFHNPPVSASCATNPDMYDWVPAAYPD